MSSTRTSSGPSTSYGSSADVPRGRGRAFGAWCAGLLFMRRECRRRVPGRRHRRHDPDPAAARVPALAARAHRDGAAAVAARPLVDGAGVGRRPARAARLVHRAVRQRRRTRRPRCRPAAGARLQRGVRRGDGRPREHRTAGEARCGVRVRVRVPLSGHRARRTRHSVSLPAGRRGGHLRRIGHPQPVPADARPGRARRDGHARCRRRRRRASRTAPAGAPQAAAAPPGHRVEAGAGGCGTLPTTTGATGR